MKLTKYITIFFVLFFLTAPLTVFCNSTHIIKEIQKQNFEENQNISIIRIAQYPRYAGCDSLFDYIFNYHWQSNGNIYYFNLTELTLDEISGKGKKPLTVDNFDLLVVGASFDSFYKHGFNKKHLNNIRKFVSDGGGYLSVCAGTVFSTRGYEKPDKFYKKYINNNALKISNVYLNLDWSGEAQYIFKMGDKSTGLVPLECMLVKNNSNPILNDYFDDTINISYGGGPGLYPAESDDPIYGEVTPLLIINEELMETKPIHWYMKGLLPGWIPFKKVKTDIKGQYAAIASTYGDGKIVIFNCHPEIALIENGTIEEYIGRPGGYGFGRFNIPPIRAVFRWNGEHMNMSHNWWLHRRAAAWIAGVPDSDLPPCNELMVFMDKPIYRYGYHFYLNDTLIGPRFNFSLLNPPFDFPKIERSRLLSWIMGKFVSNRISKVVNLMGITVIVGDITVIAYVENSNIVEFYLDDVLEFTDTLPPFEWKLDKNNLNGIHRLELRAYDEYGNCAFDGSDFFFINT
ncbi:MAG: BPL-N domain-containing protein [Candidatus Thermoplasmatota archaeon]|jgi:hypothetical protein|nr:BPL-N domain-containing protein [Candidatus Thermoplasmatota archaeon]